MLGDIYPRIEVRFRFGDVGRRFVERDTERMSIEHCQCGESGQMENISILFLAELYIYILLPMRSLIQSCPDLQLDHKSLTILTTKKIFSMTPLSTASCISLIIV